MSIILLVGASGSGKSTLGKKLEDMGIHQLVSFTTRPKRDGEIEGVDYYFTNKEDVDMSELSEISYYDGEMYGLYKKEVESKLKWGDVYFITNIHGAKQLADMYPDEVSYFWLSITIEDMIKRMRGRGDSAGQILSRIEHALSNKELEFPSNIDTQIITLDAGDSVENHISIISMNALMNRYVESLKN